MARKQKLKVYRTPIGFHDAYVAARSQKAALEAWGADADLFAQGLAETVDDEALVRAPLEKPGTVLRVTRGSSAAHMAALSTDPPPRRRAPATAEDEASTPRRDTGSNAEIPTRHADDDKVNEAAEFRRPEPASRPKVRSKPRPSRARLDKAEKALELSEREFRGTIAHLREQEKALQQKRRDFEKRHESEVAKLEATIAKARASYGDALQKWRD